MYLKYQFGLCLVLMLLDVLLLNRKASQTAAKVRVAKESGVAIVSIDQPTTTTATTPSIAAVPDQSVASNFHKELRDTCVDMLSRYAYFTSSSIPKRSVLANFHDLLCMD